MSERQPGLDPVALRLMPILCAIAMAFAAPRPALAADPAEIESKLDIESVGRPVSLDEAMTLLKVPSVSYAVMDGDRIVTARARGEGATPDTLYQAASISKFVAAVGAMRLIDQEKLDLDQDVNARLTSWRSPANAFDKDYAVTLRGLLSMTAGIGVPGFLGYERGATLPTLPQILDGTPPANSPPVTFIAPPGTYHYSGGSYEIAEALMIDVAQMPFPTLMDRLVSKPAGMDNSTFDQPLPQALADRAVAGHDGDGKEIARGWHVYPEHAAAGLWSTPTDLANLLLLVGRAWRGESRLFLKPETAREMLTPQNGGLYGLGVATGDADGSLVLMKRGQNAGYQAYLILLPAEAKGMVVMTNSDHGSILAEALIRRAAALYGWPHLGPLAD